MTSIGRTPSRLNSLSLKVRLGLLFSSLMALTICFFAIILYQQHALARHNRQVSDSGAQGFVWTERLSDQLLQVERVRLLGQGGDAEIVQVRALIQQIATLPLPAPDGERLGLIRSGFESFLESTDLGVPQGQAREILRKFSPIVLASSELDRSVQARAEQASREMDRKLDRALKTGVFVLSIFLMMAIFFTLRIISATTEPLTELSRVLDEVRVEDDLEAQLPKLEWNIPEISRVASSFEQLLQRLRGYRALNVRRLLIEKRRADVIAAAISDGIFLLRGDELMYANPVGEKILGIPTGQTRKGMRISQVLESRDGEITGVSKFETAGMRSFVALSRAISSTIPVELEVSVEENRKLHFLLQAFPISDEIIEQVEHSLHGPVERLLDRWQSNTLVLARDVTLVHESQEAKSHFIATLSHEVKTPVTSLTMATRLLKKSVDQIPNPNHRALIQTCAEDVDRLRGLIEDLLSVSRFDSLTQRLEVKEVDIGKLVRQSVQFYQPEAFSRGVEMSTQVVTQGVPFKINMDATKISWALSNLLINALRHTPKGGKVATTVTLEGDRIEVRVRDNGPGIDKGRLDKVFDKFNAFYDLRVARTGSVGMGLAIAREIITAHGGKIWVTSESGHGAEFCFNLPVAGPTSGQIDLSRNSFDHATGKAAQAGVVEPLSSSLTNGNLKGEQSNGATTRS